MTDTPSIPNPPKAAAPAVVETDQSPHPAAAPAAEIKEHPGAAGRWVWLLVGLVVLIALGFYFAPSVARTFTTISTDDAYVNGHVTFVAPRVAGKVLEVFVDDNNRVKKGDVLVRIDPEPFQVQVALKRAAVEVAVGDLAAAESQARGLEALARSRRWKIANGLRTGRQSDRSPESPSSRPADQGGHPPAGEVRLRACPATGDERRREPRGI